jgi:hypothetical protein
MISSTRSTPGWPNAQAPQVRLEFHAAVGGADEPSTPRHEVGVVLAAEGQLSGASRDL